MKNKALKQNPTSIRLTPHIYAAVEKLSDKHGVSRSTVINIILEMVLFPEEFIK